VQNYKNRSRVSLDFFFPPKKTTEIWEEKGRGPRFISQDLDLDLKAIKTWMVASN